MFATNMGPWDRGIRVVLGLALLTLAWSGVIGGTVGLVLRWLAFVPLVTGFMGWCPLYAAFHRSTRGGWHRVHTA